MSGAKCLLGVSIVDCEMKHDGNEDHDFDDIVLENECNAEEDIVLENECNTEEDEEDMNRLHSENDSSLEAGDITKELDCIDCSFEDEEIDDFEINSVSPNEKVQTRSKYFGLEDYEFEKLPHGSQSKISLDKSGFSELEVEFLNMGYSPDSGTQSEFQPANGNRNELETGITDVNSSSNIPNDESSKVEVFEEPIIKIENVDKVKDEISEIKVEANSDEGTEKKDPSCEECRPSSSVKLESKSPEVIIDNTSNKIEGGAIDHGRGSNELDGSTREWTREEDKIILQTFQHESGLEQTFETASLQLPNRSKEEVRWKPSIFVILYAFSNSHMYIFSKTPSTLTL